MVETGKTKKTKKRRRNLVHYGTFEVSSILEDRYLNPLKSGPLSSDVLFSGIKSLLVRSVKANLILTMDIFFTSLDFRMFPL